MRNLLAAPLRLFFCLFLVCSIAAAQDTKAAAPQSADPKPAPAPKQEPTQLPPAPTPQAVPEGASTVAADDFTKQAYVYELYQVKSRYEADGTGEEEVHVRIRIQSDAGVKAWGELVFGYSAESDELTVAYARVRKPDGSVVETPVGSIRDMTSAVEREAPVYTDYREKHLTVSALQVGDVLEYERTRKIVKPATPGQFWSEHMFLRNNIVLDEELEFNIPASSNAKLKTVPGYEATSTRSEGGRVIYTWKRKNLHIEDEEEKAKREKKKGKKPPEFADVQLTTFNSWEQIGTWYQTLQRDRMTVTPEIKAKADELTKGLTTDEDKIAALYRYVATGYRYVSLSFGVGRFQPHSAGDILHNKYGDCKDKSTLLGTLLVAEGYHPANVLIHTYVKLQDDLPTPAAFNHVITEVMVGKQEYWMDSTTEVAPFRLLSWQIRKKKALMVPLDGTPRVVETPADPPFQSLEAIDVTGKINELGTADVHFKLATRGDLELQLRSLFRNYGAANYKRLMEFVVKAIGVPGDVSNINVSDPADTVKLFTVECDVKEQNAIDWKDKTGTLGIPTGSVMLAEEPSDPGPDTEPLPLVGGPGEFRVTMRIALPAAYKLELPASETVKRDYSEYTATYSQDGNTFVAERRMKMLQREVPVARFRDYRAYRVAVGADRGQMLTLTRTDTSIAGAEKDAKADDLFDAAGAAIKAENYSNAIELLQRALSMEPEHKYGWDMLAETYENAGDFKKAISTYKHQLEVDPYDDIANNGLGGVYTIQHNYDDALKAFQAQVELNPLDKVAHLAIGNIYIIREDYKAAVPELQRAVSITPQLPGAHYMLGNALLKTDQTEKAIDEFEQALKLDNNPSTTWNDIAYALAEKNVELPRAERYAQSSVSTTQSYLVNLPAEQAVKVGPILTSSLAAAWDTLGWVYYREGKQQEAESFIHAAWDQDQHSEIAEHLAIFAEKRNDKKLAAQYYAMALAGDRPMDRYREKLSALAGLKSGAELDARIRQARESMLADRELKIANKGWTGKAEFVITFTASKKASAAQWKVGTEEMKPVADALTSLDYPMTLPNGAYRVFRRALVTCEKGSDCSVLLYRAEDRESSLEDEHPATPAATGDTKSAS